MIDRIRNTGKKTTALWALIGQRESELVRVPAGRGLSDKENRTHCVPWGADRPRTPEYRIPADILRGVRAVFLVLPPGITLFDTMEPPENTSRRTLSYRLAELMAVRAHATPDQLAIDYRPATDGRGFEVVAVPRSVLGRAVGLIGEVKAPVRGILPDSSDCPGASSSRRASAESSFNLLPWRRLQAARRGTIALSIAICCALITSGAALGYIVQNHAPALDDLQSSLAQLDSERQVPRKLPAQPLTTDIMAALERQLDHHRRAALSQSRLANQWADLRRLAESGLHLAEMQWSADEVTLTGGYSSDRVESLLQQVNRQPWWGTPDTIRISSDGSAQGLSRFTWVFHPTRFRGDSQ